MAVAEDVFGVPDYVLSFHTGYLVWGLVLNYSNFCEFSFLLLLYFRDKTFLLNLKKAIYEFMLVFVKIDTYFSCIFHFETNLQRHNIPTHEFALEWSKVFESCCLKN